MKVAPFLRPLSSHCAEHPAKGLPRVATPSDRMACKVKSWLSHLSIKYPAGRSAISRWSRRWWILQRSRGTEPAKNVPTILHFSFLNTVESTVIKAELAHRFEGARDLVHSCRFLLFRLRHDITNLPNSLCPNLYLLMTFCRQLPSSGHTGMRFRWPMSLP